jgi:RNA polymerase sigma-70 factor (ECF subfamily)
VDTLDEIDSAVDALRRAAPADRKAAGDRLITVMFRRIQHRARVMLGDYPRVQEQTGDLVSEVYFRLERAVRDPGVYDSLKTHQDCLRLVTYHLRFLLLDLARRVRQMSPLPSADLSAAETPHGSADSLAESLEETARLYEAMETLDPELRDVIEYVDLEGLTNVEVARRLGVNESTVRHRRERAKQALADKLGL